MLFSSFVFLFFFLPTLLLLYYLVPRNFKNYLLLLSSIIFYAWGGVSYSIILITSIILNFIFATQLKKSLNHKQTWLIVGLIFNIFVILIFKYIDFFIENINGIGGVFTENFIGIPKTNLILPIGISFFTFQQISLLWDLYRNPTNEKLSILNTALYISFFPQLIAGPIVRYDDIISQIKSRTETFVLMNSGIQRFILGLFKKIVLANTCASIADTIMDNNIQDVSTPLAWLGIISYSLQIYFDFSGYSDMAIGLGRMFGFQILENFDFPYTSQSIKEFWRRWHISLSTWFRDYVYIPLGGNKKGNVKTYYNLLIVFLLTGFWHGATWSFIFWGLFHGLFLIIERLGFDKILQKLPKVIRWVYTILIVMVGWVFFRIETISDAIYFVLKLFGYGKSGSVEFIHFLDRERLFILIIAIAASSTLFLKVKNIQKIFDNKFEHLFVLLKNMTLIAMFIYCIMYINSGSYNPFIYFRF